MILSSQPRGHVIIHQARASDKNFMRLPWVASQAARAPVAMISSRETVENDHLYFSPCTRVS
jgi:hypothetical protein